ncbi:Spore protein SP21 [Methylophilaceae bacterium]|nr:Spore protein SP21 [Methylophilaceae bacterium]
MAKEKPQTVPVTNGNETKSTPSLLHPFTEMESAFERLFRRNWPSLWGRHDFPTFDALLEFERQRIPNLDIIDRDSEIVVRAEIPGIDKKDVSVAVTDNLLTVKGQTQSEKKDEKGDYHRHEISRSSFARSVTLPGAVDASRSAATLKDGILEIKMPKAESSQRRTIAVQ